MGSVSAVNSLLSGTSTSSTSSIDLSSLLQTATGASSAGIDVTSAVQAAVYAIQAPERQWQAQQATITSQITALNSINTALTSLATDMNQLGDLSGSLASRTVTSSSSAVTATAAAGASIGQHSVAVQSVAAAASWYSSTLASGAALGSGTVTITNASGNQTSFTTGAGVDSLSALATAINASAIGVNASVVNDANGARLALVGASTGAASDFSVSSDASGGSSLAFTRASTGANASLAVDGVPINSASNTVTGALQGITLNLTGTTAAGSPGSLQVAADDSTITQAISSFVSDYNTALSQVSSQFNFNSATTSQGALSSDTNMRSLQNTLLSITGYNIGPSSGSGSGATVGSLADLGISVADDGSLSLDTTKLTSALANPSSVQAFFQGSALNGFAQSFSQQLSTYNDPTTGSIAGEISNLNQQYTALGTEVTNYENGYVASQKTLLTAMYSQAEIALQQLPTQMKEIQAELGNNSSGS